MAAAAQDKGKRFNPARSHGTVYGHISGKYEQDGILFGGNGLPVDPKQVAKEEERMAAENETAEEARLKELAARE